VFALFIVEEIHWYCSLSAIPFVLYSPDRLHTSNPVIHVFSTLSPTLFLDWSFLGRLTWGTTPTRGYALYSSLNCLTIEFFSPFLEFDRKFHVPCMVPSVGFFRDVACSFLVVSSYAFPWPNSIFVSTVKKKPTGLCNRRFRNCDAFLQTFCSTPFRLDPTAVCSDFSLHMHEPQHPNTFFQPNPVRRG